MFFIFNTTPYVVYFKVVQPCDIEVKGVFKLVYWLFQSIFRKKSATTTSTGCIVSVLFFATFFMTTLQFIPAIFFHNKYSFMFIHKNWNNWCCHGLEHFKPVSKIILAVEFFLFLSCNALHHPHIMEHNTFNKYDYFFDVIIFTVFASHYILEVATLDRYFLDNIILVLT